MNSIGNDVCCHVAVGKNRAQQSRVAMVESAHGIEGVRSVSRSGVDARETLLQSGVGMPNTDTHSPSRASSMRSTAPSNSGAIVSTRMRPEAASHIWLKVSLETGCRWIAG